MDIRQAVLIVGGSGTRLWPLTETLPKALLPVAGDEFVNLQINALRDAGVDRIVLAVSAADIDHWSGFAVRAGVSLIVEETPLDTAGGIRTHLADLDERFLALNGDVMFDTPIAEFTKDVPDTAAVLALVEVEDPSGYGVVVTDAEGMVVRFVEKPPRESAPSNTVSAGMYLLHRRALERYPAGPLSFERTVFPDLAAGGDLAAKVVPGQWLDIGIPELYLETNGALLAGHRRHRSAVVEGRCSGSFSYVDERAVVEAGAEIVDSIVLAGGRVEDGATIENAIVGWDAVVGRGARLERGVVLGESASVEPESHVPSGSRVGPGESWLSTRKGTSA